MAYRSSAITPFFGSTFPVFSLRREIDRLFDDLMASTSGSRWMPAVDVREDDKELLIDVEVPGIKPEDLNVSVENGVLSVSGEKRAERKEGEEGRYHTVERTYGSFFRSFQLPKGVDESQINANYDNGVLTISIPKAALPQPRRIQIGGAEKQIQGQTGREQVSGRTTTRAASGERMAAAGSESTGNAEERR
ncbi:MAG: Hsp20/alpha crystallin family protein [Gemmatimonadaceae bacterium]|nr:Hsp20/alpha crystallin family protein [Gemmatimonadaceae bacterium]